MAFPSMLPVGLSLSSHLLLQAAALDIAMIKMVAPSMAYRVIDRAIQVSTGWTTTSFETPSPSMAHPPVNSNSHL